MAGTAGVEPPGARPCPLHPGGWAQAPIVSAWAVGGVRGLGTGGLARSLSVGPWT